MIGADHVHVRLGLAGPSEGQEAQAAGGQDARDRPHPQGTSLSLLRLLLLLLFFLLMSLPA